ncbi:MAG: Ig-like domain-containing protein [Candidatus Omnitrophota bacterium]
MLQHNGLYCAVKALAFMIFAALLAMPVSVSAQSDVAARVRIQGSSEFGDVLLLRDGNDIVLYGLAFSVPSMSNVTVTAAGQEFYHNAAYTGQFPVLPNSPIRIVGGASIPTASISAVKTNGTVLNGTVNLDLTSPEILKALQDYQAEVAKLKNKELANPKIGIPVNKLLDIVADNPSDQSFLGKVLLTQRITGSGNDIVVVDQIEGLSFAGGSTLIRSVTPNSQIEVYSEPIKDINKPDATKRIQVIDTVFYSQGQFASSGSFFPFSVLDANSSNTGNSVLYLRITARSDRGANGATPKVFAARILNDIAAEIAGAPAAVNNNVKDNPEKPGASGLANISGIADPYSLLTAYVGNAATSDVIAQATSDGSGKFKITIPGVFGTDGIYISRKEVYLAVLDPFGNVSSTLTRVETDAASMIFGTPTAADNGDGTFLVQGEAEPLAKVIIRGYSKNIIDGKEVTAVDTKVTDADASGAFSAVMAEAQEFTVQAIDQAGNVSDPVQVAADVATANPTVATVVSDYPYIKITGKAERGAFILFYAFPLDKVPSNANDSATQPADSYLLQYAADVNAIADANGNFAISIPGGISKIVYLQAVDRAGNASGFTGLDLGDLSRGLIVFDSLQVTNQVAGMDDIVKGKTVKTGALETITGIYVGAFAKLTDDPASDFPFLSPLADPVAVAADGQFEITIPERDPLSGQFVVEFYLVALDQNLEDLSFRDIGFVLIGADQGFDRVGPEILFNPNIADIVLNQAGAGYRDTLSVRRVLAPGLGSNTLPDDSLPFIIVIADGSDDTEIDVNAPDIDIVGFQPLLSLLGLPFPGAINIDLGDNHWNAGSRSVFGRTYYYVALMDQYGNLSPNPIRVKLDVAIADPKSSLIAATGQQVFGYPGSVEPNANVSIFETPSKSNLLGAVKADANGTFYISVSLTQEYVYIVAKDAAGNESNALKTKVSKPIVGAQFVILDGFGVIHTPSSDLTTGLLSGDSARALSGVKKVGNRAQLEEGTPLYILQDDGSISKLGESGQDPKDSEKISISGKFARDLVVTSYEPFAGYVLLGNGLIIPFGNAPFFGDILQLQRGYTSKNRLRLSGTKLLFDDLNDNKIYDTEDKNSNGVLDVVIGSGGIVLVNEDVNKNGKLDVEPLINPEVLAQGFEMDIARDLELVRDASGAPKGYVILDGFGIMWPFGDDIGAENVKVEFTTGVSDKDIFRALELVVEDGKIVDFVKMNGYGQLFVRPGGVVEVGKPIPPENLKNSNIVMEAPSYSFDIARDLRLNPEDSNGDGAYDWKDGFYILNGYGGIDAIGGAPALEDYPFLGFDIARDLEFGTNISK